MRKHINVLNESSPRRRRSWGPVLVVMGISLLISPLLYESGQVVASRWLAIAGRPYEPHTPIFDTLSDWSRRARQETQTYSSRYFGEGSIRASTAVPFAIGWSILMAVLFLRRAH